jgi:hypothetical protein
MSILREDTPAALVQRVKNMLCVGGGKDCKTQRGGLFMAPHHLRRHMLACPKAQPYIVKESSKRAAAEVPQGHRDKRVDEGYEYDEDDGDGQ